MIAAIGLFIMQDTPNDIVATEKIRARIDFLRKSKMSILIGSNVGHNNVVTRKHIIKSIFPLVDVFILLGCYKGDHVVPKTSVVVRANMIKKHICDHGNVKAQDHEIFANMVKDGLRIANIEGPLSIIQIHAQSFSNEFYKNNLPNITFKPK